jgi:hypothetical protein
LTLHGTSWTYSFWPPPWRALCLCESFFLLRRWGLSLIHVPADDRLSREIASKSLGGKAEPGETSTYLFTIFASSRLCVSARVSPVLLLTAPLREILSSHNRWSTTSSHRRSHKQNRAPAFTGALHRGAMNKNDQSLLQTPPFKKNSTGSSCVASFCRPSTPNVSVLPGAMTLFQL